jgi:hypothetical protein
MKRILVFGVPALILAAGARNLRTAFLLAANPQAPKVATFLIAFLLLGCRNLPSERVTFPIRDMLYNQPHVAWSFGDGEVKRGDGSGIQKRHRRLSAGIMIMLTSASIEADRAKRPVLPVLSAILPDRCLFRRFRRTTEINSGPGGYSAYGRHDYIDV